MRTTLLQATLLACGLAAAAAPAHATPAGDPVSFSYTLTGFSGGGSLTISASGYDVNQDGVFYADLLSTTDTNPPPDLLTTFSFAFSGSSTVPDFTITQADLGTTFTSYQLGFEMLDLASTPSLTNTLAVGMFLAAVPTDPTYMILVGCGFSAGLCVGVERTFQSDNNTVTQTDVLPQPAPEPAGVAVFAAGLLGLRAARRRLA